MGNLIEVYNSCYKTGIIGIKNFKKEIKDKDIKVINDDLSDYLNSKIEADLTELEILLGKEPVKLKNKHSKIKTAKCSTLKKLNKHISELNEFSRYVEVFVKEARKGYDYTEKKSTSIYDETNMDSFLEVYNEYFKTDIDRKDFIKELKSKKIKDINNSLSGYLNNKINVSLTDLAKETGEFPVKLRNKHFKIKTARCFTIGGLNKHISRLNSFYHEVDTLTRNIQFGKYSNKLEELKAVVKDEEVLKIINKELLKLNTDLVEHNDLNKDYYDQLIIDINDPNSSINNIKPETTKENKYSDSNVRGNISKYSAYMNNPLLYFDVVKMDVASQNLDEDKEKEILDYIDELREEYKYLFTTTMNPNSNFDMTKLFMSLDSLIDKKIHPDEESKSKVA